MDSKLDKGTIIFDLDGTLVKSAEGIICCMQETQKAMGMEVWLPEDLKFAIGPPLEDTFSKSFKIPDEKLDEALEIYRSAYEKLVFDKNSLFDGVEEMLQKLKDNGKILAIGTSKLESVAVTVLKKIGIDHYFDLIAGHDEENYRDSKGKVIAYAMNKMHSIHEDTILIGDRKFDILGAKEVGIECMAVLYGYGDMEEFEKYGADYIVNTTEEITNMFC